jgi:hypothetical protein
MKRAIGFGEADAPLSPPRLLQQCVDTLRPRLSVPVGGKSRVSADCLVTFLAIYQFQRPLDGIEAEGGTQDRIAMHFGSGPLVVAVNVLVVVALLVMPLIYDWAVRLLTRRLRGSARLDARSALPNAQSHHRVQTDNKKVKARRVGPSNQSCANREELAVRAKGVVSYERSAKLVSELGKRSTLIDAQKTEIIALKIQVETLKARLKRASNDRDVQNLENRLVEQSRRLNESELELEYLRDEIEVGQKAEADLRRAIIEIDGHAKRATQNHETEKAKLQAALDRANGERARLAYELAKMKQQAERTTPAKQVEDVMLRECVIDAECSGSGERTFLHQPLIEPNKMKNGASRVNARATVLDRAAQTDVHARPLPAPSCAVRR